MANKTISQKKQIQTPNKKKKATEISVIKRLMLQLSV